MGRICLATIAWHEDDIRHLRRLDGYFNSWRGTVRDTDDAAQSVAAFLLPLLSGTDPLHSASGIAVHLLFAVDRKSVV